MRKILSLLLMITIFFAVGCSSKEVSQKTKAEEKLKVDLETSNYEENNQSSSLKTFEDVFSDDLNVVLDYFNENLDKFSENEKVNFAKSLIKIVATESEKYQSYRYEDLPTAYVPMYPTLDSELYDFYDFETKEFNIGYFKDENEKYYTEFSEIRDSKLFTIATEFLIDNGVIDLPVFVTTLKSDIYALIKPALDLVPEGYKEIHVRLPNMLYKDVDFSSQITQEAILVENFSQLKEFDGKETWKSTVLMPVIFVEKDTQQKNEVIENIDEYLQDKEYSIDLNGDGEQDTIMYINAKVVSMKINNNLYELDNQDPDLTYNKFNVIDLDTNDKSIEIVLSQAEPPMDNYLTFYRYNGEDFYCIGSILGNFEEIDKTILIDGSGTIGVAKDSTIMEDGIFYWEYTMNKKDDLENIPVLGLNNYSEPIHSKINEEIKAYNDKNTEVPFINIPIGEEIVIYGEINNWLNIEWGDKELWINGDELDHSRTDGVFQFEGIKFWS